MHDPMEGHPSPAERIRAFVLENGEWYGSRAELTDDVPLLNNVLDSVGVAELVSLIESELGVEVENADLDSANFETIGAVVAFIEGKRRAATG
jgi:acyl carrier protein